MQSKSYAALDPEKLSRLDPNSSYARIRDLVGSGKRVLDIGCGPGNLAAVLRATGNTVVGIDNDQAALVSAARFCERTIAAELDAAELESIVGDDRFDIVVFADVLEHLRDPARLLGSSRSVLRHAGCAIVSIPNVAHGAVRLALLRGRFEYQQLGILDETHLRFYTRETVMRLLSESGFAAVRVDRTTAPVFERSDLVPFVRREDYDAGVVAEVLRDEDAETLQFVIRAAPVDEAQVVAVLTAEITSLQQAVRTLRAELAQARDSAAAHANGIAGAERLAEVEQHYNNQLAAVTAASAERDLAVAAAERAAGSEAAALAEAERLSAEVAELTAAADRAHAELEAVRAALDELRVRHDEMTGAFEPLRDDLLRAQQLAGRIEAERNASLERAAAAEGDSARAKAAAAEANAAVVEAQENLRTARALIAEIERELDAAREEITALRDARGALEAEVTTARAGRDEAAARVDEVETALAEVRAAAEGTQRDARGRIAALQAALSEVAPERRALQRRAADLANLLVVERATREHVEESADRILAVARERDARVADSFLQRLLARSAAVELELQLALSASRRAPAVPVPPAATSRPELVLRTERVGRRTLTVLAEPAGRRSRLRAAWRRLRRLLPLMVLLAVSSASCAAPESVISDPGPAFVRIGDDPSVYFLPARSSTYCLVAEAEQMKRFGGFARVKQYDPGARFPPERRLDGLCKYPDGVYVVGGATYVLRGNAICRGNAAARNATTVSEGAKLSASRRDVGRCRSAG